MLSIPNLNSMKQLLWWNKKGIISLRKVSRAMAYKPDRQLDSP
jgi:hypothetical protein